MYIDPIVFKTLLTSWYVLVWKLSCYLGTLLLPPVCLKRRFKTVLGTIWRDCDNIQKLEFQNTGVVLLCFYLNRKSWSLFQYLLYEKWCWNDRVHRLTPWLLSILVCSPYVLNFFVAYQYNFNTIISSQWQPITWSLQISFPDKTCRSISFSRGKKHISIFHTHLCDYFNCMSIDQKWNW